MYGVNREITWPVDEQLVFFGRNGTGKCSGLWITDAGDYITLRPLTSRGQIAKCSIDVPKTHVHKLAEILAGLSAKGGAHEQPV
jgi:hypothetical protein